MKKIIISLAGASVLVCGCNNSTSADKVKIEELSQKLDVVLKNQGITISNQIIIFDEIAAVNSHVTNEMVLVNGIFTDVGNLMTIEDLDTKAVESHLDASIMSQAGIQFAGLRGLMERDCDLILTNLSAIPNTPAATPPDTVSQVLKIEHESDFEQMKEDVSEIQEDLRKIKIKLGIIY